MLEWVQTKLRLRSVKVPNRDRCVCALFLSVMDTVNGFVCVRLYCRALQHWIYCWQTFTFHNWEETQHLRILWTKKQTMA